MELQTAGGSDKLSNSYVVSQWKKGLAINLWKQF